MTSLTQGERSGPAIRLNEQSEVSGDRILLADLLPRAAQLDIYKAAATIDLGRAPQPGSLRAFTTAEISRQLAARPEMFRHFEIPARITVRRTATTLGHEEVWKMISSFLREQGWKDSELGKARGLWLPGDVAPPMDTAVVVSELSWDNRQQALQMRLRCAQRATCSSFLVQIPAPQELVPRWREQVRVRAALKAEQAGMRARNAQKKTLGPVLVEAGKRATLVMNGDGIRMSLPVVCLERGRLRQQIRVRTVEDGHIFRGEVTAAGLLRMIF